MSEFNDIVIKGKDQYTKENYRPISVLCDF